MKSYLSFLFILAAFLPLGAVAAEAGNQPSSVIPFHEIWSKVQGSSKMEKANSLETRSQEIGRDRASRHWYPHFFLDARAYSTDDPGMSLFSLLGTRSVTMADFAPDALNHPERSTYERITLGGEWALYEGGMRSAMTDFQSKMVNSKQLEGKAVVLGEYSNTAQLYGMLLVLKTQENTIAPVRELLDTTISSYSIGIKSNPVGYSGLLGMKALRNRLDGEIAANHAKRDAAYKGLAELAPGLPAQWSPATQPFYEFTESTLKRPTEPPSSEPSFVVRAQTAAGEGMLELKNAERARFLPKVALFGEGYWLNGSRDSATAFTAGTYLQWDIFNAGNYGAVGQAKLNGEAVLTRADAKRQQEMIEATQLREGLSAARKGIDLAEQSLGIMQEQTAISRNLFRNGMINALQFTEVLSRRVDLILARTQAQEQYLTMSSKLLNYSPKEIPTH